MEIVIQSVYFQGDVHLLFFVTNLHKTKQKKQVELQQPKEDWELYSENGNFCSSYQTILSSEIFVKPGKIQHFADLSSLTCCLSDFYLFKSTKEVICVNCLDVIVTYRIPVPVRGS